MNAIVTNDLETQIATMQRVQITPEPPLGFGRDLSCVQDMTENFDETDPDSAEGIAEAVTRRLTCPRGGLLDDPNYGIDLKAYLNHGSTFGDLRTLETRCINEASKDERVGAAEITIASDALGSELTVSVSITPYDPALRPFQFVFAVTDAGVLIQTIGG
jgi:hypothetical protein